ncbi:hypothetical protein [Cloacibacillus sp.]|uniref:hypothetical protein n=1 Tax=Cloacibacillus sp. TaxID=2049023 RepID=UPI0025BD5F78|nr:hypothetical protein [Cloacibacillus sp.]
MSGATRISAEEVSPVVLIDLFSELVFVLLLELSSDFQRALFFAISTVPSSVDEATLLFAEPPLRNITALELKHTILYHKVLSKISSDITPGPKVWIGQNSSSAGNITHPFGSKITR